MRNTFSWLCASCGEYNVIELKGRGGSQMRCDFCFRSLQPMPSPAGEPRREAPPVLPCDDWIGDSVVRPFFSAPPALENPGRPFRRTGARKLLPLVASLSQGG